MGDGGVGTTAHTALQLLLRCMLRDALKLAAGLVLNIVCDWKWPCSNPQIHILYRKHSSKLCFPGRTNMYTCTHRFVRVPADYYDHPLEYRQSCLHAASIDHLCKSMIMENTRAHPSVDGWSNPNNSKYYLVIVQVRFVLGGLG